MRRSSSNRLCDQTLTQDDRICNGRETLTLFAQKEILFSVRCLIAVLSSSLVNCSECDVKYTKSALCEEKTLVVATKKRRFHRGYDRSHGCICDVR